MADRSSPLPEHFEIMDSSFRYEPRTGTVYRLIGKKNPKWRICGTPYTDQGYKITVGYSDPNVDPMALQRSPYLLTTTLAKLIWYLYYGEWLERPYEVLHMNDNMFDNRITNLRKATRQQSRFNAMKPANTTSQYRGVYFSPIHKKWLASITINGKCKHLGLFEDEKLAALAYNEAALAYCGDFARINKV